MVMDRPRRETRAAHARVPPPSRSHPPTGNVGGTELIVSELHTKRRCERSHLGFAFRAVAANDEYAVRRRALKVWVAERVVGVFGGGRGRCQGRGGRCTEIPEPLRKPYQYSIIHEAHGSRALPFRQGPHLSAKHPTGVRDTSS